MPITDDQIIRLEQTLNNIAFDMDLTPYLNELLPEYLEIINEVLHYDDGIVKFKFPKKLYVPYYFSISNRNAVELLNILYELHPNQDNLIENMTEEDLDYMLSRDPFFLFIDYNFEDEYIALWKQLNYIYTFNK